MNKGFIFDPKAEEGKLTNAPPEPLAAKDAATPTNAAAKDTDNTSNTAVTRENATTDPKSQNNDVKTPERKPLR